MRVKIEKGQRRPFVNKGRLALHSKLGSYKLFGVAGLIRLGNLLMQSFQCI